MDFDNFRIISCQRNYKCLVKWQNYGANRRRIRKIWTQSYKNCFCNWAAGIRDHIHRKNLNFWSVPESFFALQLITTIQSILTSSIFHQTLALNIYLYSKILNDSVHLRINRIIVLQNIFFLSGFFWQDMLNTCRSFGYQNASRKCNIWWDWQLPRKIVEILFSVLQTK